MKGGATTHTTNAAYRAGWERVFGSRGWPVTTAESEQCRDAAEDAQAVAYPRVTPHRPMFKPVYGPGETPDGRDCCVECGGEVDLAAGNNVYCSTCLAKP